VVAPSCEQVEDGACSLLYLLSLLDAVPHVLFLCTAALTLIRLHLLGQLVAVPAFRDIIKGHPQDFCKM
jgi:hypothetical protein